MGRLTVLNGDKEEKYSWSSDSLKDIQIASEKFNQYMKQGFIASKIVNQGKMGVHIAEFDLEAEEIIMLRLAEGG